MALMGVEVEDPVGGVGVGVQKFPKRKTTKKKKGKSLRGLWYRKVENSREK